MVGVFMWKIILIAISLSMDAFSLALSYGTNGLNKKDIQTLSTTVGIFHFFMPLIGMFLGNTLLFFININTDVLVFVILSFIGIEMLVESFKKKEVFYLVTRLEVLLFALAVSLDSLSIGIGFSLLTSSPIFSSLTFALMSAFFTYVGLRIGDFANKKLGSIATIIGGLILLFLGILYII